MFSSTCAVCDSKKLRFHKEQETSGLLSSLGIKTSSSQVPLLGLILLCGYKMNEIVNKFILARYKFMSEMHLRHPEFTYSSCEPFTTNNERIKNLKKQVIQDIFIKNEVNKACFQHDLANGDFKELPRRTAIDKGLRDKAFNMAKNQKMIDINVDFLNWFYIFFR